MDRVYHVSKRGYLKILKPHHCSHQAPYVYGSNNLIISLLFGGKKWSDWDFILRWRDEPVTLFETYAGAFADVFKNQACYIYEVEGKQFLENRTRFGGEVVCSEQVCIINKTSVPDLYELLEHNIQEKKLKVEFYQDSENYKLMIRQHIINLIKYSDYTTQPRPKRLEKHFGKIVKNSN